MMMKRFVGITAILCVLAIASMLNAEIGTAPAPTEVESLRAQVKAMEAEITQLKAENIALKSGTTTASPAPTPPTTTSPAPKSACPPLEAIVNTMPQNLRPSDGETSLIKTTRMKWLDDHLAAKGTVEKGRYLPKSVGTWTFTGKIKEVVQSGKNPPSVGVRLDCGMVTLLGTQYPLSVVVDFGKPIPEAATWKVGQILTESGPTYLATAGGSVPQTVENVLEGKNLTRDEQTLICLIEFPAAIEPTKPTNTGKISKK